MMDTTNPSHPTFCRSILIDRLSKHLRQATVPLVFLAVLLASCSVSAQTGHFQAAAANMGSVNIGASSAPTTLTFTFDAPGSIGSVAFVTRGVSGLDFAGAGTCSTNAPGRTYVAGDTCTVTVTFSPLFSGDRFGAVLLKNGSGTTFATEYVYGVGQGPQVTLTPGTIASIATLPGPVIAIAADDGGNLYTSTTTSSNRGVVKESPSGATYTAATVVGGIFNETTVAVDGAGIVYVADPTGYNVYKETPSASGYIQSSISYSTQFIDAPLGIAVDGAGNVYVALDNSGHSKILKQTLTAAGTYNETTLVSGSNYTGVTVDGTGTLYISSSAGVLKETLSGSTYTESTVATVSGAAANVAVDGNSNVYIASTTKGVLKESFQGGTYTESVVAASPGDVANPRAIAIDGHGNLFVSTGGSSQTLVKIDLTSTPTLTFANTNLGSTSVDSPKSVSIANIGNAALVIPKPSSGTNASISAGFVLGTGSTACPQLNPTSAGAATLAINGTCSLSISFTPTFVGADVGTVVLTDNSLNASPSTTQTINLNGTGTGTGTPQAILTPTVVSFGSVTAGATGPTQNITLSNPGSAALPISSITVGGTNPAQFPQSNNCGSTLAAGASCTIVVGFNPATAASYAATLTVTDTVGTQSASLSGTGTAPPAPQAALSPNAANFGSITVGTSTAAQIFTLGNAGNATLPISSISLTGTNPSAFAISAKTCGNSLAAGTNCTISVTFSPLAAGVLTANLTVIDSVGTQTASLTGQATALVPADFAIVATPATQSSYLGTTVTYQLAISPLVATNPFSSAINLSAVGLPSGATATFSPATVTPGATNVNSVLTITVPALVGSNRSTPPHQHNGPPVVFSAASLLALALALVRKRSLQHRLRSMNSLAMLVVLGGLCIAVTSCASGTGFAVPQTTSTITVTGTSGALIHSTTVTLILK